MVQDIEPCNRWTDRQRSLGNKVAITLTYRNTHSQTFCINSWDFELKPDVVTASRTGRTGTRGNAGSILENLTAKMYTYYYQGLEPQRSLRYGRLPPPRRNREKKMHPLQQVPSFALWCTVVLARSVTGISSISGLVVASRLRARARATAPLAPGGDR
ncbi:hypothetical protein EVAR_85733_1 [Eumeta japonica]|uniref:Uncharacterized protein n=1 Tax=Eumeta variegata TaxID=151549 RepID=A0A4C1Y6B1_EUMVA|nr:hypothetical protein EVAR_85733_1 [Eumeta japonica]